jgi:amphi-Trp domain-containing protein
VDARVGDERGQRAQRDGRRREHVADARRKGEGGRHNDIEFERGGMRFTVSVPDELDVKIELEVESDKRELEIELTW